MCFSKCNKVDIFREAFNSEDRNRSNGWTASYLHSALCQLVFSSLSVYLSPPLCSHKQYFNAAKFTIKAFPHWFLSLCCQPTEKVENSDWIVAAFWPAVTFKPLKSWFCKCSCLTNSPNYSLHYNKSKSSSLKVIRFLSRWFLGGKKLLSESEESVNQVLNDQLMFMWNNADKEKWNSQH